MTSSLSRLGSITRSCIINSATKPPPVVTGGSLSLSGSVYTYTFTTSAALNSSPQLVGTITFYKQPTTFNALVVSGGGGGGAYTQYCAGGGGGGGNVLTVSTATLTAVTLNIYVGCGGTGGVVTTYPNSRPVVGTNSYLTVTSGSITINGTTYTTGQSFSATNLGYMGAAWYTVGVSTVTNGTGPIQATGSVCSGAGAGGGGGQGGDVPAVGTCSLYPASGGGSGSAGGTGNGSGNPGAGGGGGGSGSTVGSNALSQQGAKGGNGTLWSFNSTYYGGGGAGGSQTYVVSLAGGLGGGGSSVNNGANNGTANTGGGGSGASSTGTANTYSGGNGANGIVIISFS